MRAQWLSQAECVRVINSAESDFRSLVRAALATGARFGQLASAKVEDFDAQAGTLRLRSAKGRGSTKVYDVPLSDEAVAFFVQLSAGRRRDNLLLVKPDGSAWRKSEQARPWRAACQRAGIPPLPFHCTRHSFASLMLANGAPVLVVARCLGHSDGRMVERVYGKHDVDHVRQIVQQAAPRFGEAASNVRPLR